MTINVISDLHCSYDHEHNKVIWNRKPYIDPVTKEYFDEEGVKKKYNDMAIQACIDYKGELYRHKKSVEKFDPNKITFERWRPFKHKIRKYDECVDALNKIISYLSSNHYKRVDYHVDLARSVSNFATQACREGNIPYMDRVIRALLRRTNEFVPEKLQSADYLIVAGDLGLNGCYKEVYKDLKERTKHLFKDVFFIKGNHDYWCFDGEDDMNLEDRFFEKKVKDVVFLGCTMWAPVQLMTWSERCCVRYMNDYRLIPNYTSKRVNSLYAEESEWLRTKTLANKDKKVVIFTHHNPYPELIDDDYKHSEVNAAYAVLDGSCNDIKPNLWICGHSHSYRDCTVNGVHVVRNPIGYRETYDYLPSEVNPEHWYNTVIEI